MAGCPSCRRELPGSFPFCPYCGAPLEAPAAGGREERKIVSVLFCDLVGFTAASEQADPEDVRARIRPYGDRVRAELEGFGGTVEKFIGDAVMAVFGAPAAHEDDPERAIRAGLRILEAIAELNAADPDLRLEVRVGIATGEALVSLDPKPGEGFAAGDVVNTAARIQGVAPVGGVAVSEETFHATERVFVFEPLPDAELKGKSQPVRLYRALEPRARFGSDIIRDHTRPFVGRDVERNLMRSLFDRTVRDQSLQLVTLVGEPGIGKSRLVAELFVYADERGELIQWRQGRCLPYGEGIAFWALGEIVKAHAGIYDADEPAVAEAKLDRVLPDVEERAWLRARLLPLVGIDGGVPPSRQESFAAWRRFLEEIATEPAVLVFEDIHWADPALLEFVGDLAEWVQGVPLMVVCTARPELYEKHPGWAGGVRNAHTINLSPLNEQETAELVRALLEQTISADVEEAILERSGGNPLYAEEFVRLAADRLDDDLAFPDSVQALIAARLDTLPPERKRLLQDAAVLGKVFTVGGLARMGDRSREEVEHALHELGRKELVRRSRVSSLEGDVEYSFWHLLVRDVAYAQIPRAERARRHRLAAAWLEEVAGERPEDQADLLAFHLTQALELGEADDGDALRAAARRFLVLAGERAFPLDVEVAASHFERALAFFAEDDPERLPVLLRWGEAAGAAGRSEEAVPILEREVERWRAAGDPERTARTLLALALVAVQLGGRRAEIAAEAIGLLEPGPLLAEAYDVHGAALMIVGDLRGTLDETARSIALLEELGLPVLVKSRARQGLMRLMLGDATAWAETQVALEAMIEDGAGRDAASFMNNLSIALMVIEGPPPSLALLERGEAFCGPRGLREGLTVLRCNRIDTLIPLGRIDEALELVHALKDEFSGGHFYMTNLVVNEGICRTIQGDGEAVRGGVLDVVDRARDLNSADVSIGALAAAAALEHATGRVAEGVELLRELEAVPGARDNQNVWFHLPELMEVALAGGDRELAARLLDLCEPAYPWHVHARTTGLAQLAEYDGDHAAAAAQYGEAAAGWRALGHLLFLAQTLLWRGRSLLALGEPDAARVCLDEARTLLEPMGAKLLLAQVDGLLRSAAAAS